MIQSEESDGYGLDRDLRVGKENIRIPRQQTERVFEQGDMNNSQSNINSNIYGDYNYINEEKIPIFKELQNDEISANGRSNNSKDI
jgi:hypothetical protein